MNVECAFNIVKSEVYLTNMNLEDALTDLKMELILIYPKKSKTHSNSKESKKWKLIEKIETITGTVAKSIAQEQSPVFKTIYHSFRKNCYFDKMIRLKSKCLKTKHVNFERSNSRSKFVTMMFLLSRIHRLLVTSTTSTRRELYYENLHIFQSQKQVDENMKDITYILKTPSWDLGILASSRGFVSGPLVLYLQNGEHVNCNKKGGVSIPLNVSDVENVSSSAQWVLIVEKDASFQKLLDSEPASKLGSCIFITGKGYPDVSTRMLVCKLWEHLQIPILALIDADPYGIEIMCIYRFGSMSMSSNSISLACPVVRWLGIHPSDIKPLLLESKSLSDRDIRKVKQMLETSHINKNLKLKSQLQILLRENAKAEIEGLSSISKNYLTDNYLKNKIYCKDYF